MSTKDWENHCKKKKPGLKVHITLKSQGSGSALASTKVQEEIVVTQGLTSLSVSELDVLVSLFEAKKIISETMQSRDQLFNM